MQRAFAGRHIENTAGVEKTIGDILKGLDAGEDPRKAIAQLNKRIVAYQSAGEDVPPRLLRLSQMLSHECIAQSQGR